MAAPLLAGDVGGTKTALRLQGEGGEVLAQAKFESAKYADLSTIVLEFLANSSLPRPQVAAFGVAGPVISGGVHTTNLPWHLDEPTLGERCGLRRVRLLNDFEATAYGVLTLKPSALHTLQAGQPRDAVAGGAGAGEVGFGTLAVIGAGTGLGEAIIFQPNRGQPNRGRADDDDHGPYVVPSEGGHGDFAPRDDLEIELLKFLRNKFGRVSWERVVSGMGIANVYEFLRDTGVAKESPKVAEELKKENAGAVIGRHALEGDDALCLRTIDLFIASYGAEAGNLVLRGLATGGVYLTGGVAPKLLSKLKEGGFLRAFRDKGRLSPLVEKVPVHVVLDQETPLHGAAYVAERLSQGVR